MEYLPANIILTILNLLPNESSKFSFAFITKENWRICSSPNNCEFKLNKNITALELHKCSNITIRNQFYDVDYLRFILKNASNLSIVRLDERKKCPMNFIVNLITACNKRNIQFIVPTKHLQNFENALDFLNTTNITLGSYGEHLDKEEKEEVDVSKVKTPEHFENQVQVFKDNLKRDYYLKSKGKAVMKNNLSHILACSVNRFFETNKYHNLLLSHQNDTLMRQTKDLNADEATRLIKSTARDLLSQLSYWKADDCADQSTVNYQSTPIAFIRRKSQYGKDYFELTIRFGYVELVVTSGFFGSVDGSFYTSFLGSSLRNLPDSITADFNTISTNIVYIPIQQKNYICKNRIMNQYFKSTSTFEWGYYSKQFEDQGFTPGNPLSFQSDNLMHTIASFILKSYSFKRIDTTVMNNLINRVNDVDVCHRPTNQLIKKKLLELKEHGCGAFTLQAKSKIKDDLITIYNKSLANGLKTHNSNGVKKQNQRFMPNKLNIFYDDE